MQYETSAIRKGLKVEIDGAPYIVADFQFVKPGKGVAFTRTRLKNMETGAVLDRTFRTGEKIEKAEMEERKAEYLYMDGEHYCFMDSENYEQYHISESVVGDAANFLTENAEVDVLFHRERPLTVQLPNFVELAMTECPPGVKGDTASGATKVVVLETGARLNVPLFINEDDVLRIDTRTGQYVERVKK